METEHVCQHCRHWIPRSAAEEREYNPFRHGYADYEGLQGWGVCRKARTTNNEPPVGSLAFARDYEEYHADLLTSPEYGCVMFEPAVAPF